MTPRTHRRDRERVGLLLVLCVLFPGAWATQQNAPSAKTHHPAIREADAITPWLVSADQGLAILGAALESRKPTDPNADCSNFVHAIYERAGFSYSYANSVALYQGVKEFRRVLHPQPGDLVVWRGHVGIVISPVQHSFFSAMRSGHGVEYYDSPYWQGRGRPRFFRYLKAASRNQLSASVRKIDLRSESSRKTDATEPVIADQDFGRTPGVSKVPSTGGIRVTGHDADESAGGATGTQAIGQGPQVATLQKPENQIMHDGQIASNQDKPRPTVHKLQGPDDGVWQATATKPSAGIPFAAETATPPPAPVPSAPMPRHSQSSTASSAVATGPSHADVQVATASKQPAHAPKSEPTQWAMSRYVPRPPWSLPAASSSGPAVARPPAAPSPRAPGFYLPSGQYR
jgi:NlpC/P60 family